jgi:exoribonuclease-2
MILIYEDSGKLHAGREFSRADNSLQVESPSGKRSKIKLQQVLLELQQTDIPALDAPVLLQTVAEVDLNLAWEFAPEDEFSAAQLALDYFGDKAQNSEKLALLLALVGAPHYFRRAGKNRFKKATAEVLQLALAGIEKRKRLEAQIDEWVVALQAGSCPEPIAAKLYQILFKPDKNGAEYKAVAQAAKATNLPVLELLQQAGALQGDTVGAYHFHWQRFLFEHFPKGTGFADLPIPPLDDADLPLAEGVQAYSIDDSSTTEIDDALSVQNLDRALVTVGIHIAAPALALQPGTAWDGVARDRMSTVYMPGNKITMLPPELVQHYTLGAGQARAAVSLYLQIDKESLEILDTQTKIERVPVVANLRLETLEPIATHDWLCSADTVQKAENLAAIGQFEPLNLPEQLSFLYRLAQHWKAQRELVRGKPENFSRPDFNFKLRKNGETVKGEVQGDEEAVISIRKRGEPIDLIVAECAIVANSTWGQWLGSIGVPMIYRSQAALLPGVKVRMGAKPLPHAGMGVKAYAWASSPLRRYVDLLNQWQLIAAVRHGATAALSAPFKPKDAQLFAVISSFDAAYSAYNAYQSQMERFWTLRHIQQAGIAELDATVFKDEGWVRADSLPLVCQAFGAEKLPRGSRVRIKLGEIDLLSLHISAVVHTQLSADDAGAQGDFDGEDEQDDTASLEVAVVSDEAAAQPSAAAPSDPDAA